MTDDTFYLTPIDVRRYPLKTAKLGGYEKANVEQFRDEVANELERLNRVNHDLASKAKSLQEQLRAFHERDQALNDALISAQQLRAEIREQAEREAQLILREARAEGERLVEAARDDIRRLEAEVASLVRVRRSYLAQLRQMAEWQLAEVEAAEASEPRSAEPAEPPPSARQRDPQHPTPAWLNSLVKE